MRNLKAASIFLVLFILNAVAAAQFIGPRLPDDFRDKSLLHPPAGSKVAIIVFEDLGCPGCAYAHPLELKAAAEYHIPIVRYDFPIAAHIWTFNGAVCARYLQDKVDPTLADQYRTDVFAAQSLINNKDDLVQFTRRWMQLHGHAMPFVLDPNGALAAEVKADYDRGHRLNVTHTPTIVVVTRDKYQLVCGTEQSKDPSRLFPILKAAVEQTHQEPKSAPSARPRTGRSPHS